MDADALHGPRAPQPTVLAFTPHRLHQHALNLIAGLAPEEDSGVLPAPGERPEAELGQYDRLRALALLDGEERLAEFCNGDGPIPPTTLDVA